MRRLVLDQPDSPVHGVWSLAGPAIALFSDRRTSRKLGIALTPFAVPIAKRGPMTGLCRRPGSVTPRGTSLAQGLVPRAGSPHTPGTSRETTQHRAVVEVSRDLETKAATGRSRAAAAPSWSNSER